MEEKLWFKNWPNDVPRHLTYPTVALPELLRKAAKGHPKKPAITYLDTDISYAELDSLADNFAAALAALRVQKGDCVAIFLPNIPQFIIAYYGVLRAGAILTTISPLHREREIEYQLRDSGAKTVVTLDSLYPFVETVWRNTKLQNVVLTSLDEYSKIPISHPAEEERPNVHSFQELVAAKKATSPELVTNAEEDLAALQYTGGTTGNAKGAMLTHMNLVSNAIAFATWIKSSEKETFLVALPLFHIYGMTTSLNAPVSHAAKMVLLTKFEPAKVLSAIQQHHVTVFCGVPTMYQALLANPDLPNYDLTSIRVCISGASPLAPQVQKNFMQVTGGLLAEGYGLTEASPVTHCSPADKTMRTVRGGSIGLPLPDTEARIVDVETGERALAVGETGELAVRGPQVMKGYWGRPEETALIFRDGWLLTGDLAYVDNEGYFYLTDRKKDLIKYKDYSVYPRELEDILYEHPAVQLCAVIGKPDTHVGEIVNAFVVLKKGVTASEREIADFVNNKVAPYKAIRSVEFRDRLPISAAGKVLKRSLREEESSNAR
jgi:long-chain acyl-CoA synthetase